MLQFLVFNVTIKSVKWTTLPRKYISVYQYRKSNIPQINLIFSSCPVLPIRALYWVLHMIFLFFPWSSWHKRDKEYISYPLLCYVIYYCHSSRTHNTSIFVKCSYPHFVFSYQSNLAEHLQAISIPLKWEGALQIKVRFSTFSMFTATATARRACRCDLPPIHLNI